MGGESPEGPGEDGPLPVPVSSTFKPAFPPHPLLSRTCPPRVPLVLSPGNFSWWWPLA